MPAHVRRFSGLSNDADSEYSQQSKRRKVSARNAHFDAMIDTMNTVRRPTKDIHRQTTKSLSVIKLHAPTGIVENDDSSEQSSRSAV